MKLFEPVSLRDLTLRNHLVVSPMCQYSAVDGMANDYHLIHLGRFALGGFGLIIVEATGVVPEGRITHGDLGLWSDEQIPGLARVAQSLKARRRSDVQASAAPRNRPSACRKRTPLHRPKRSF